MVQSLVSSDEESNIETRLKETKLLESIFLLTKNQKRINWPKGLHIFWNVSDSFSEGEPRKQQTYNKKRQNIEIFHFLRHFAICKLSTKDVSIHNLENNGEESKLYQVFWRQQTLPGCVGSDDCEMELTDGLEISTIICCFSGETNITRFW